MQVHDDIGIFYSATVAESDPLRQVTLALSDVHITRRLWVSLCVSQCSDYEYYTETLCWNFKWFKRDDDLQWKYFKKLIKVFIKMISTIKTPDNRFKNKERESVPGDFRTCAFQDLQIASWKWKSFHGSNIGGHL